MRVAVIRFPGANCDQDALHALRDDLEIAAEYVWHGDSNLAGFDGVFVPGGFSFGDYLRCGAIASRSPIMAEVIRLAKLGRPVIGACNGFQILCESGLLPGALMRNLAQKFICHDVHLQPGTTRGRWLQSVNGVTVRFPIAHGEGRYVIDGDDLKAIQDGDQIAFRYADAHGNVHESANPNGSADNIAGVINPDGNVLGLMPHPERAMRPSFGYGDGALLLRGFLHG
ncbi:MAG: phosphoribosylformylglycinamidine synthase I [Fimbriimonadaceae bacterium]|nr:phosphoribosylformylglycinamidine synthase I [Fimbriimonadaceae bacterium]